MIKMESSTVILIILGIFLVGVIGFLVYYFILKDKNKITKSQPSMVPSISPPVSPPPLSVKKEPAKPSHGADLDGVLSSDENKLHHKGSKNEPYDTGKRITHEEKMRHFFQTFPTFKDDKKRVIAELSKIDYVRMDKGKVKDFIERQGGYGFEDADFVMDGVFTNYQKRQDIESIKAEYPHYHNMHWPEEDIRRHLRNKGYSEDLIKEASREYHQKNIYNNYINELVKHIKPFILTGKGDSEILSLFKQHNWPDALILEAIEKVKITLEQEHSVAYLQEEILKLLLEGDSKTHIAKVLSKQGWPEDELKKNYNDLESGLSHLETALKYVDVNEYNLDRVRQSLKAKHWPDEVIEMTLNNLVKNIDFHKKLDRAKKEIETLVKQGMTAKQVENKMVSEGFELKIIKRMIDSINQKLAKTGDRDKIKSFNNHVFTEDEWHKQMHNAVDGFDHAGNNAVPPASPAPNVPPLPESNINQPPVLPPETQK